MISKEEGWNVRPVLVSMLVCKHGEFACSGIVDLPAQPDFANSVILGIREETRTDVEGCL